MITLNKKQVKALIDILNSESCKTRPALQTIRIKRDGYMYITNGYLAIRFKLESGIVPREDSQEEFIIPVENLTKWYKMAERSDYLDELTICSLEDKDNDTQFPNIDYIYRNRLEFKSDQYIKIDVKQLDTISKAMNQEILNIEHFSDCIYITSANKDIDAILMEMNHDYRP